MRPAVHLLLGFPGTGKYTVGKALVAELEQRGQVARLVDSHYVANTIFGVVNQDGMTPLPEGVWPLVGKVREAVLTAIEDLSPKEWTFVFTNFITTREIPGGTSAYLDRLERIASDRGGELLVTRLSCDLEELCLRVVGPDRKARLKMTSAERLRQIHAQDTIYEAAGRRVQNVDVTSTSPEQAARQILTGA